MDIIDSIFFFYLCIPKNNAALFLIVLNEILRPEVEDHMYVVASKSALTANMNHFFIDFHLTSYRLSSFFWNTFVAGSCWRKMLFMEAGGLIANR